MASKKKKCPYTNFFYPFNLGLGPRAQLMLLLYEDITLIELYTRSYKEILKVHKRKIMDKLEISPVTLDKHISSLKNRKLILTTDARGRYRINTQLLST